MDDWAIGLDAWIIQDGNYPDFHAGQTAEFAVEFYMPRWNIVPPAVPNAERIEGARYGIVAEVVATVDRAWVIDCGIQAFSEGNPPDNLTTGAWISGEAYVGVDPFSYFERLGKLEKMPPLIYGWNVRRILKNTAPWIEAVSQHDPKRPFSTRDESRQAWKTIDETDAWHDDAPHQSANYVLECERLPNEPKRSLNG